MIKISLVVPVYNVENYVLRCLKSVENQTYKPFECILIDDCSTDQSAEICNQFIESYKGDIKFLLIRNSQNKGLSTARNIGTLHTTGDYLLYIDSDDELTFDCLQKMVKEVEDYPQCELVQGTTKSIPYKEYYNKERFKGINHINDNKWIRDSFFNHSYQLPVNAWNKLIKRSFIIDNNITFKDGLIHEDQLWMFYVANKLTYMSFVHADTYIHYTRPNSIMTNLEDKGHVESWGYILKEVICKIEGYNSQKQLLFYLYEYLIRFDELSTMDCFSDLPILFRSRIARNGYFIPAFALLRLINTKHESIRDYYKQKLITFSLLKGSIPFFDMFRFEFNMLRVDLALGYKCSMIKRLFKR